MRRKIDLHNAVPEEALLFTSLFTVGELEKGISRADYPEKERTKVDLIMPHLAVLMPGETTARVYGELSADLDNRGQRIPENDMWIAAMAKEHSLTLVTGDAHFACVPDLQILHLSW